MFTGEADRDETASWVVAMVVVVVVVVVMGRMEVIEVKEDRLPCPPSSLARVVKRHRAAKFSEHTVSPELNCAGLMLTKVNTLEFPPRDSCRRNVSFEFL
jgi:hypothetical protein